MQRHTKEAAVIVAVGTDHHPFNRLVEWIDDWAASHPEVSVLVQRGTSLPTAECPSVELLPHAELCERFGTAAVVVSHGGPSTVMDARKAGRLPIVFARDPAFDEHVDDHQMRFADHLRRHDLAVVVDDQTALHAAIDEALAAPKHFSVPVENATISGGIEFGRVLDQLLDTVTPLVASDADLPDDVMTGDVMTGDAVPVEALPESLATALGETLAETLIESPSPNLERNSA